MTVHQIRMLRGMWGKLAKKAKWDAQESECQRTELTIEALQLGVNDAIPSWGRLNARQVDAIKGAIQARLKGGLDLVETVPGVLESHADSATRKRLIHGIEADAQAAWGTGADSALCEMMRDIYGPASPYAKPAGWKALPIQPDQSGHSEMERLRMSVSRR